LKLSIILRKFEAKLVTGWTRGLHSVV
jgi:hypothetical protein